MRRIASGRTDRPLSSVIAIAALAVAALALPFVARAAAARSVADTAPSTDDPAYQRLRDAANAVVGVKTTAVENARSNESLGQERSGSGIVIGNDGLVLTVDYLVVEAAKVEITGADGHTVPASVVASDDATGLALVRALAPLPEKPIPIGTAAPVKQLDRVMIVSGGEDQSISVATVVSKRRFAGYWEYLLDNAIFTSPPRLDHSGAALINKNGELVGIGSLFVMDAHSPGERLPGNMFVPVDVLKPILDDMVRTGAQHGTRRPWLGVNSLEEDGRIKVLQVNEESPADKAGLQSGDLILAVEGEKVGTLEAFYRKVWALGQPGVDVHLEVLHGTDTRDVTVHSMDRRDFVRHKQGV